jgi:transcriptional regulator
MDYKTRPNPSKGWLPQQSQQGQRPIGEFNQNIEIAPFPGPTRGAGGTAVLDDPRPALREMLQSNNYHLALVSHGQDHDTREQQTKPSSPSVPPVLLPSKWKELVARVCEFVRDTNLFGECRVVWLEDVCVDFSSREAYRSSGEPVTLTNQEFKTLKCFLSHPGRALSREELLNQAWGYENYPSTRTVDNHVLRLRQKFERDPGRPVHFLTVHGLGYKFVP